MVVRHVSLAFALLGLIAALSLSATGGAPFARASQDLPTPKGQLGGPMPLPTGAVPAAEDVAATPGTEIACDREPVSVDELLNAAVANPLPLPEIDWSSAAEANAVDTDAARAVVTELIACANRNDPARTLALFTADGIARALQRQGITAQTVATIVGNATGVLPASAQARLVALDRVLAGAGDHLRVEFTLLERSGIGELELRRYSLQLSHADGAWLIEDVASGS